MELVSLEVGAAESGYSPEVQQQIVDLIELQLALVGGGIGDTCR